MSESSTTEELFHIVGRDAWSAAESDEAYTPEGFAVDGFVHLSDRSQILRPANLLYRGREDLILLELNPTLLSAPVVIEPGSHGEDELFPHLYGPLNPNAVVRIIDFPPNADGSFSLPSELG